jgi:hypothetical protein
MPLLLVVEILMVVLFDVSGLWTIAGAVFVLGVAVMVMVGIVQAVDGAWPRTWWPRPRCSQCAHRGHARWACQAERSPTSPPGWATF